MNTKIIDEGTLSLKKTRFLTLAIGGVAALLMFSFAYTVANAQTLSSQVGVGSRGATVSNLQTFLSTNYRIYPEALVTGYYGQLTKNAVMQFQLNYNISPVGNVGPITVARINSVISSGLGLDITAPAISNVSVALISNTSARIGWNTDTYAKGQVYYDTQFINMSEALIPFATPGISGATVQNDSVNLVQSISLQNLAPNTTYFYVVKSTDVSGNVSLTWPSTFRTNP